MGAFTILWEKTLNYLEERLPMFQYNVWIKELKPFTDDGSTYLFEVSSQMHKNLMMEKYGDVILLSMDAAYRDLYGAPSETISIKFVTPDEMDEAAADLKAPVEDTSINQLNSPIRSTLNLNHTFDTFVVGESNKFANAAAHAVASAPGHAYNPLFLYGGVGLGKTHLMHAIGNKILESNPSTKIVYVTSETFTNELINMISRTNNNANIDMREQFRNKYRKVDVLMIDDIQFIAGKDKTQDEFFHTFNALHELNKQIIISSDRPPKEMEQLEERMRSRFEWGLIADIKMPDYETRVAILMKKSEMMRGKGMLPIKDEVYHFIAKYQEANIRTLEGALQKVMMYAELHREEMGIREIGLNTAERALEDYFSSPAHKNITPKIVTEAVCAFYDVQEDDIRGSKKSRDVAFPRQVAMYIMRDVTELSYIKIAEYFGKKDHTTIMYAEEKIKKQLKEDPSLKRDVDDIIAKIRS